MRPNVGLWKVPKEICADTGTSQLSPSSVDFDLNHSLQRHQARSSPVRYVSPNLIGSSALTARIDGACDYGNETQCGQGVARAIKEGLVKREDLWITSKLWNTFHAPENAKMVVKKQLSDWQLNYFDVSSHGTFTLFAQLSSVIALPHSLPSDPRIVR